MEEFCKFRNFPMDHSTINRLIIKFSALLEKNDRKQKRKFLKKYYIYETYVKAKGVWMYLYRAIDRNNETIDFYLSSNRRKEQPKDFSKECLKHMVFPKK